jgi:hypothetical protein
MVGIVALIWGTSSLAQAGLFTMAQVWNLPGPERPGYLQRLGRAPLFLGVLGLGVIVTTLLTALGTYGHIVLVIVVLLEALAVATNIGITSSPSASLPLKSSRPASCRDQRRPCAAALAAVHRPATAHCG